VAGTGEVALPHCHCHSHMLTWVWAAGDGSGWWMNSVRRSSLQD
jgi:hypothetical protein